MKPCTGCQGKFQRWCRSPWGIVILVVFAISFGGLLALGGDIFLTVSTGVTLFCYLALILLGMRQEKKAKTELEKEQSERSGDTKVNSR